MLTQAGALDILNGVRQWRLCYLMGSADIRRRYARSKLGQFWIMLTSAIMISGLGLVWSFLWHLPVGEVLPFVGMGMIIWQFISGNLTDATIALSSNGHYFLNQYTPASTIIFAMLYRNVLTFLLNLIFPVGLAIAMGAPISWQAGFAILGLILLAITCFWAGFVISILCARFRDIIQIVNSVLQVAIFMTPVFWKPELLPPEAQWVIWNPLAILISVVRDPLLGRPLPPVYWIAAIIISFVGLLLTLPFVGRFRRRLIYWL